MIHKGNRQVAVFDIDGVVVTGGIKAAVSAEQDLKIDRSVLEDFFRREWGLCIVGKSDLKERLQPYLNLAGQAITSEEYLSYWFRQESGLNVEVLDFASKLRKLGVKCYLGSNQEKYRASFLWNDLGLRDYFDDFLYSGMLGAAKPDACFFEYVQKKIGIIDPSDVYFIDDCRRNVEAARAFGWQAELYPSDLNLERICLRMKSSAL